MSVHSQIRHEHEAIKILCGKINGISQSIQFTSTRVSELCLDQVKTLQIIGLQCNLPHKTYDYADIKR